MHFLSSSHCFLHRFSRYGRNAVRAQGGFTSQMWSCVSPTTWGTCAGRVQRDLMIAGPTRFDALLDDSIPVRRQGSARQACRVKRCTKGHFGSEPGPIKCLNFRRFEAPDFFEKATWDLCNQGCPSCPATRAGSFACGWAAKISASQ